MDKIRSFLKTIPERSLDLKTIPIWEQGFAFTQATIDSDAITVAPSPTLIGVLLPHIDPIVNLFTKPMLAEAEELLRRQLIEFVTMPEASSYFGKRNSNKIATYLETTKGAPPMEHLCKLFSFLLNKEIQYADATLQTLQTLPDYRIEHTRLGYIMKQQSS